MNTNNFLKVIILLCIGLSLSCTKGSEAEDTVIEEVEGDNFAATGAPTSYTTKLVVMDFTGSWCGYCPNADKAIKGINNPNVFSVGYHVSDNMANPDSEAVDEFYGERGYPDVLINGDPNEWNYSGGTASYSIYDIFDWLLSKETSLGLGISTSVEDSKISLTVKVGYASAVEKIKLVIYLLEDGYVYRQANYVDDTKPDPITDYVHNNILRKSFTKPLGDAISSDNIAAGGIFTKTILDLDMPSTVNNTNNLSIVAFVVDEDFKVLNIQKVKLGETIDFE